MHKGTSMGRLPMEVAFEDFKDQSTIVENELFGLWRDRSEMDDVDSSVRKMRQGRTL
jgi:hypothetical protein